MEIPGFLQKEIKEVAAKVASFVSIGESVKFSGFDNDSFETRGEILIIETTVTIRPVKADELNPG